jgi:hypothetical protein
MIGVSADERRGRAHCGVLPTASCLLRAAWRSSMSDGDRRRYEDNERVPHHRSISMSKLTDAEVQRGRV